MDEDGRTLQAPHAPRRLQRGAGPLRRLPGRALGRGLLFRAPQEPVRARVPDGWRPDGPRRGGPQHGGGQVPAQAVP
eukprot:9972807-Alexandrium_andersonii.AAC.1